MLILRKPWTRQPQVAVGVNWSNPLTRGLVSAAWRDRNIVNGATLADSGSKTYEPALSGIAEVYDGAVTGRSETVSGIDTSNGLSIHVIVYPTNIAQTNTFAGFGSTSATHYAALDLSGTETNDPIRVLQTGGTFGCTYYASPPTNQWNAYTAVFNSGTNNVLYRDGVLLTPSSTVGSASANFPTISRIDHGQISLNTGPANRLIGKLLLRLHWNRRLTAGEARMLADNPWQLFAPQQIIIPTPAAAVVPTLSASTYVPGSMTSTGWRPQITAS